VVSAFDPLLSREETERCCATAYRWGEVGPFRAIVAQTADPLFANLDPGLFPDLAVVFDGRDSLRALDLPATVAYRGIGLPGRARTAPAPASS
jgi:hypothetical protein